MYMYMYIHPYIYIYIYIQAAVETGCSGAYKVYTQSILFHDMMARCRLKSVFCHIVGISLSLCVIVGVIAIIVIVICRLKSTRKRQYSGIMLGVQA